METLAVIGLIGNVVQFVDFSGKLISKSAEIYHSSTGALAENADIETATDHLIQLNKKLRDAATLAGDGELRRLCTSCSSVAEELLGTLDKVKVKGDQGKLKSIRKAIRSVWSKDDIEGLERRLARFREELNFYITMNIRYAPSD
jgi:N-terminal domain on NACHT_NTPase and P-loop NTPases